MVTKTVFRKPQDGMDMGGGSAIPPLLVGMAGGPALLTDPNLGPAAARLEGAP